MKKNYRYAVGIVIIGIAFLSNFFFLIKNEDLRKENIELQKKNSDLLLNGIEENGALNEKEGRLVTQLGKSIQLRGMSSHGLTWYPEYTNYASIRTTKEAGANVFRIAAYSEYYVNDPRTTIQWVLNAIENTLANDMYVIVDWHILKDSNPNTYLDQALGFFDIITSYYPNHPGILYEICNEPNQDTTWSDIKLYANIVIPRIREQSPASIILVGTPKYSTDLKAAINEPLAFENIFYTYHQYLSTNRKFDSKVLDLAIELKFPVFISEWGTSNSDGDGALDIQECERFLSYVKKNQISWINWSLSNKDESSAAIDSNSKKLHSWNWDDLSESGKLVFKALSQ